MEKKKVKRSWLNNTILFLMTLIVFVIILSCYAILSCIVFIKFKRNYNNFKKVINENQLMLMKNEKIIYNELNKINTIARNIENNIHTMYGKIKTTDDDEATILKNKLDEVSKLNAKLLYEIKQLKQEIDH